MTEYFSFFDAVETSTGVYDREYNAQQFTDYFRTLVTTGVMKGQGSELKVFATDSNMISTIDDGTAFIEGRYYHNDNDLNHTHDTESVGLNRIDRIVVRMNLNTNARDVKSFIKKGVASVSPNPPSLTRDANIYEISLAQVKITGGQTFVRSQDIKDERGTDNICPWAGSNILPNFDNDELEKLVSEVASLNRNIGLKANKLQEFPINLSLQNGWLPAATPKLYKDDFGVVHLSAEIHSGTTASLTTLLTLPIGYRPTNLSNTTFMGITYDNNGGNSPVSAINFFISGGELKTLYTAQKYILIDISFRV